MSTSNAPLRRAPARACWSAPSLFANPPKRLRSEIANAITIDVEDYFQVEAFASTIDRKDWDRVPPRVVRNTERLLDILAEGGN